MRVSITRDGETETVDVDVSLDTMTLQESVRLERALGPARFEQVIDGGDVRSPIVLQAVLWAKLATHIPGLKQDEFDLDFGELAELLPDEATPPGMVVPMTTPDGATTDAEVGSGSPGKASASM